MKNIIVAFAFGAILSITACNSCNTPAPVANDPCVQDSLKQDSIAKDSLKEDSLAKPVVK